MSSTLTITFFGGNCIATGVEYWISYDSGEYGFCVGLQGIGNDVWLEGAIKLTPVELNEYDGWSITVVKFYLSPYSSTHTGHIQVYDNGESTTPGSLITQEPFFVTSEGWKEITLSSPVTIAANKDIWISVKITHNDGEAPLSYDSGTAVAGKEWVNAPLLGLDWQEMATFGFGNWMLRVKVEEKQLPEEGASVETYVILANNNVRISKDVLINSGDIGVNIESDGTKETLLIGKNVKILSSSSVIKADFIKLKKNAEVWDIYYNALHKHKKAKILGTEYTPLTLPVATFPPFPDFSSGSLDITVKKNNICTIDQGEYRNIKVRQGGKLIFTGGVYNIATLTTAKNVQLIFQDNSEVRIENSLMVGKNNIVGPDTDTSPSASDVIFYVSGEGTDNVEAVTVRMNGEINANIYAPSGTIDIRKNTEATGAFIGENVVIGKNVQLTWDSAFQ